MKIINFISGFSWASSVVLEGTMKGFAKVNVCNESFWIRDCEETEIDGHIGYRGIISNTLLNTDSHRLKEGEEIFFIETIE